MTFSKRNLEQLHDTSYDVVIVGGGVSGAWLSLHCAQQGYKTALIDKGDYASQTSSASSKLLHGGIRYLQQMQFTKVRESAMERAEYIYAAPHLSTTVPFLVPTYKDFKRSKFFLNCGMLAYQALCLGQNSVIDSAEQRVSGVRSISAHELNQLCDLENEPHTGAVMFNERHMIDSERMVLAIIQTARSFGAQVHNYVCATGFLGDQHNVTGVAVRDELSGDEFAIDSRLVINAAGPWIDKLNGQLMNASSAPSINGYAVGSHIITRQLCDHAIAITTKHQSDSTLDRGGRHVFVIPWRGYSLIGTSYDEIESPDGDLSIQSQHVDQLLEAINDGLPNAKLSRADIVSGFSGLYPLKTDNIKSTVYQGSGEYQIIDHLQANKVSGLITALGAKFTTGRKISELTIKLVNARFNQHASVVRTKLLGSDYQSFSVLRAAKLKQYASDYSESTIDHLLMLYGSNIDEFLQRIDGEPSLQSVISEGQADLMGQVVWAIEQEQATSLDDVIYRRTSLALLGISDSELERVANVMATYLPWGDDERDHQLQTSRNRLLKTRAAIAV